MKIVKQISTGKILYRQSPDFEEGKGILNACIEYPDVDKEDMIEIDTIMTEQEYKNRIDNQTSYIELRKREYPPFIDYIDAKVKQGSPNTTTKAEGVEQETKYIQDCLNIKAKYLKN